MKCRRFESWSHVSEEEIKPRTRLPFALLGCVPLCPPRPGSSPGCPPPLPSSPPALAAALAAPPLAPVVPAPGLAAGPLQGCTRLTPRLESGLGDGREPLRRECAQSRAGSRRSRPGRQCLRASGLHARKGPGEAPAAAEPCLLSPLFLNPKLFHSDIIFSIKIQSLKHYF